MRIWDYRGQLRRMEMDLKKARDRASELERENARLQEQTDVLLGELSQLRGGESGETG
jgi:predicted nuclease with TOPRIM domain